MELKNGIAAVPLSSRPKPVTPEDFYVFHDLNKEDNPTQELVDKATKENKFVFCVMEGPTVLGIGDDVNTIATRYREKHGLKESPHLIISFVLNLRARLPPKVNVEAALHQLAVYQFIPQICNRANASLGFDLGPKEETEPEEPKEFKTKKNSAEPYNDNGEEGGGSKPS
jgi:hypothetical protein